MAVAKVKQTKRTTDLHRFCCSHTYVFGLWILFKHRLGNARRRNISGRSVISCVSFNSKPNRRSYSVKTVLSNKIQLFCPYALFFPKDLFSYIKKKKTLHIFFSYFLPFYLLSSRPPSSSPLLLNVINVNFLSRIKNYF